MAPQESNTFEVLKVQLEKANAERRMNSQGANALVAALSIGTVAAIQPLSPPDFRHGVGLLWIIPIAQIVITAQYVMLLLCATRLSSYTAAIEESMAEYATDRQRIGWDYMWRYRARRTVPYWKDSMVIASYVFHILVTFALLVEICAIIHYSQWPNKVSVSYLVACVASIAALFGLGLWAQVWRAHKEMENDMTWMALEGGRQGMSNDTSAIKSPVAITSSTERLPNSTK